MAYARVVNTGRRGLGGGTTSTPPPPRDPAYTFALGMLALSGAVGLVTLVVWLVA